LLEGTQEEKVRKREINSDKLGILRVERVGEDVMFETVARVYDRWSYAAELKTTSEGYILPAL
jgi:hypothetical protein